MSGSARARVFHVHVRARQGRFPYPTWSHRSTLSACPGVAKSEILHSISCTMREPSCLREETPWQRQRREERHRWTRGSPGRCQKPGSWQRGARGGSASKQRLGSGPSATACWEAGGVRGGCSPTPADLCPPQMGCITRLGGASWWIMENRPCANRAPCGQLLLHSE